MIKIQKTSCNTSCKTSPNTSCKTSRRGLEKFAKSDLKEAGF